MYKWGRIACMKVIAWLEYMPNFRRYLTVTFW
jgi:hypothetical protein